MANDFGEQRNVLGFVLNFLASCLQALKPVGQALKSCALALRDFVWPKGAYKAKWLLLAVLLAEYGIYGIYHLHLGNPQHSPPDGPAPTPGISKSLPAEPTKVLTNVLTTRPGLGNVDQLYALQTVTSLLLYNLLDRVKLWEKFKATLLFRQWPAGANLLIMAAGELLTMLCFGIWLHWITFPGVSFGSLLLYVYTSLQLTKATAEAITRHIDGELSLQAGLKIAITCHSIVILAVIFVIPLMPFLLDKIGLLFQLWAYAGIFYTVVKNF